LWRLKKYKNTPHFPKLKKIWVGGGVGILFSINHKNEENIHLGGMV